LKAVELFAKEKEEHDGGAVLNKKIFKLADKELLVRDVLINCVPLLHQLQFLT
jgi:hypothetical protein